MKLLVIDCRTGLVRKYEDRKYQGNVRINADEFPSVEAIKAALENYRIS